MLDELETLNLVICFGRFCPCKLVFKGLEFAKKTVNILWFEKIHV